MMKNLVRKILVIFITFSFIFTSTILIFSHQSEATPHYSRVWPTATGLSEFGVVRSSASGGGFMARYGGYQDDIGGTYHPNYYRQIFAIDGGFRLIDGMNRFNTTTLAYIYPDVNATIGQVYAIVQSRTQSLNDGWFSVGFINGTNIWDALPHSISTFDPSRAGIDNAYWHNSSLFPENNYISPNWPYNLWDITTLYSWNYTMLNSTDLYVMWNTHEMNGIQNIDYVGLEYYYVSGIDITIPIITSPTNMYGIIWLLVIYAPATVMAQFVPKLGFVFGISLMLIMIGASYVSFIPYTIIGLISVGVMLYKGR